MNETISTQQLKALEEAARKANNAVWKAWAKKQDIENAAIVGKCFKFRNCYSCPEKPSDYWWLYLYVLGATDGRLNCFAFETYKNGVIKIEMEHSLSRVSEEYKSISKVEFSEAWHELQASIQHGYPEI